MSTTVHRTSLDEFVISRAASGGGPTLGSTPTGVCVLRSEGVAENLKRRLAEVAVPVEETTSCTTIEGLARSLLAVHHGREPSLLDNRVLNRVVESLLEDAAEEKGPDPLVEFVDGLSISEEIVESVQRELEDYFISTDSGRQHDAVVDLLESVKDPFGRHRSAITLDAFEALHEELQARMEELPEWFYLTRSHLVTAARDHVDAWEELYPGREWLAMGTINVLDNPTLRFFAALESADSGPDLHFFFGAGSEQRLTARLDSAGLDVVTDDSTRSMTAAGAHQLFESATGQSIATEIEAGITLVEAPDRRREIMHLAEAVREHVTAGTPFDELLVVAENLDDYRSIITDIFHTHELPFDIETRTPMAHTVAYRFCKSTLELLNDTHEPVSYTALIDPLRLGFCHPDTTDADAWPLDDRQFLRIEQSLSTVEAAEGPMALDEWRAVIQSKIDSTTGSRQTDWEDVDAYLEWIEATRSEPPDSGEELAALLTQLLDEHLYQTASDPVRSSPGPGVETARNDANAAHQTYAGSELRGRTDAVKQYFRTAEQVLDATPGWELANRALGDVVGSRDIGYPHADANTIRFVEAENAYYRNAANVFMLGLSAGEFPAERENKAFLHDTYRETVDSAAAAASERTPLAYLYLPTKAIQYEQGLNRYETALAASTGHVQLSMHYLNSENDPVSWSPFVDLLPHDAGEHAHVTRLGVGTWLPSKQAPDDRWFDVWDRVSERDRIRAYTFYTTTSRAGPAPVLELSDIQHLAIRIEGDALSTVIQPKRTRYLEPPTEITVSADEDAFTAGASLEEIIGEPFHPHEIDVFAQCPLRYYFYQLYFVNDGDSPDRDVDPNPASFGVDHRYGTLPQVIRRHQTTAGFRSRVERLISTELPDRAALIDKFATPGELVTWAMDANLDAEESLDRGLIQNLIYERRLVEAEHTAGSTAERDWTWVDGAEETMNGYEVYVPGHREDRSEHGSVPVLYAGENDGARQALKACWSHDGDSQSPRCADVCESCADDERCRYPSKQLYDHRLHLLTAQTDDVIGVEMQDRGRSAPVSRHGLVSESFDSHLVSHADLQSELKRLPTATWEQQQTSWRSELVHHMGQMRTDEEITYKPNDSYIAAGGCEGCVYRELCQIPLREGEQG